MSAGNGAPPVTCFDAAGGDISLVSKRDTGLQVVLSILYSNKCRIGSMCVVPLVPDESSLMYEASAALLTGTGFTNHMSQFGGHPSVMSQRLVNRVAGVQVQVDVSGGVLVPDGATAGDCRHLAASYLLARVSE